MYMLIENFHANISFRYWWKNFFLICFNVIKYLLTTRAFWQDCSIWSKSSLFSLSFVAICNWFCTWTVIMNTLDTFIWTACQHTNKTLFIMNDHLVKSTKNVTWKKTKRTSISNITWAAALDPSCTPCSLISRDCGWCRCLGRRTSLSRTRWTVSGAVGVFWGTLWAWLTPASPSPGPRSGVYTMTEVITVSVVLQIPICKRLWRKLKSNCNKLVRTESCRF